MKIFAPTCVQSERGHPDLADCSGAERGAAGVQIQAGPRAEAAQVPVAAAAPRPGVAPGSGR